MPEHTGSPVPTLRPGPEAPFVARAQGRAYLAAGLFSGFFVLMGVLLTRESAQTWPVLVVACGVAAFMLAGLAYLRLEVGSEGIRYRSFGSNRALRFSEIERAYFETVVNRAAPRGLVTFWIKPKAGNALRVNLRTFPPGAATRLLTALERHGIAIAVPDSAAALGMTREPRGHAARPGPRRPS